MYAMMSVNYGSLKKGKSYSVLEEGRDWVLIKAKGRPFYVSKGYLVEDPISQMYDLRKDVNTVVDEDVEDLLYFGGIYE